MQFYLYSAVSSQFHIFTLSCPCFVLNVKGVWGGGWGGGTKNKLSRLKTINKYRSNEMNHVTIAVVQLYSQTCMERSHIKRSPSFKGTAVKDRENSPLMYVKRDPN